jgi:hypothetical protein
MAGILDSLNDPAQQGLLALALGMLQRGGPQPRPTTVGQAFGGAGMDALQTMQEQQDRLMKQKFMKAQLEKLMQDLKEHQDAVKQREIERAAGAAAYQTPLGEANQAGLATGFPLARVEAAAPQEEAMKTATGGISPDSYLREVLSRQGDPLRAVQVAQGLRKAELPPIHLKSDEELRHPRTFKLLASNPKPKEQWEDVGLNERGQLIQIEKDTGKKQAVGSGPLVNVGVNLPKDEEALHKALGKGIGEEYVKDVQAARQGQESLATISQLRMLAQQGRGVSGGPVAQYQTVMLGLANQAGFKVDTERLIRDQNYRSEATKLVLDNIGSLARATEKEGEMVKESLLDPTKFNAESLELRFQVMEARARRQIARGTAVQNELRKNFPNMFPMSTSPSAINSGLPTSTINPESVFGGMPSNVIDWNRLPRR